jgi:hypothetical protein
MAEQAFIIQQIGAKDSPERKRADEIYKFIVSPAVKEAGLEPYRADLDLTPGPIAPRMLSELISARIVIADLTGRNPNVFYELGITHSFARPLISIADSVSSLPFDTKDERVIILGEYVPTGLTYIQGEEAKTFLKASLAIVLADDYTAPSPLREVAANASVDDLAPENPVAAEMAQMREALEDIRKKVSPRSFIPPTVRADIEVLRNVVERNIGALDESDFQLLITGDTSPSQGSWTAKLRNEWGEKKPDDPPWLSNASPESTYSDEPPF